MRYAARGVDRGDLAVELPARDPDRDGRAPRWRPATRSSSSRPSNRRGAALRLVEALHEAGVPAGALALLPGYGEAGGALVGHPGVQTIAFTGSLRSGSRSSGEPPRRRAGQGHIKRVVAEMGGKNCVIVDADADLDEAVPAI